MTNNIDFAEASTNKTENLSETCLGQARKENKHRKNDQNMPTPTAKQIEQNKRERKTEKGRNGRDIVETSSKVERDFPWVG